MSDRCWMEVTCRRRDARRFEKLGFKAADDEGLETSVLADLGFGASSGGRKSETVRMQDEQANYGHSGELPKNIPYFGWHGSGGEYGPCRFACDGRKYVEVEASPEGDPVVRVSENGKADTRQLKMVRAYRECLKRAEKAFGKGESGLRSKRP